MAAARALTAALLATAAVHSHSGAVGDGIAIGTDASGSGTHADAYEVFVTTAHDGGGVRGNARTGTGGGATTTAEVHHHRSGGRELLSATYDSDTGLVTYDGHDYITMDECPANTAYGSCSAGTCQNTLLSMPDGYELAVYSQDVVDNVVANYPWGTHVVVFSDGSAYGGSDYTQGQLFAENKLLTSGSTYAVSVCALKVLMRSIVSAAPTMSPAPTSGKLERASSIRRAHVERAPSGRRA